MIPREKIVALMEQLLEKTRRNEVNWQGSRFPERSGRREYHVAFPKSQFIVEYISPETEPDFVLVSIRHPDDAPVSVFEFGEPSPDWDLAEGLFREAERYVTGWDEVLTDLEQSVGKEGRIGIDTSPIPSVPPPPPSRR